MGVDAVGVQQQQPLPTFGHFSIKPASAPYAGACGAGGACEEDAAVDWRSAAYERGEGGGAGVAVGALPVPAAEAAAREFYGGECEGSVEVFYGGD